MLKTQPVFLITILWLGIHESAKSQVISALTQVSEPKTTELEFDGKRIKLREGQFEKLTVSAQLPSLPVLKYRLFPALSSLKKGDASTLYHRAILFHRQHRSALNPRENRMRKDRGEKVPYGEQTFDELSELLDKKLTDQEIAELRKVVESSGQNIFEEIRLAAGLRDCDWGFDVNEGRPLIEYISFLLPEIQEIRSLTRFLALRAKVQIASKDFEGAIETVRCGLKMAKCTEDTRFMICSLVGVACSNVMLDQLEAMLASENAPNLYWALEVLPQPILTVKKSVVYEIEFLREGAGLQSFQEPEKKSYSAEKWSQLLISDLSQLTQVTGSGIGQSKYGDARKFLSLAIMLRGYPIAKRQLVKWGFDKAKVEAMPAVQVLAIHESRMLKIIGDEILKCLNLDVQTAIDQIEKVSMQLPGQIGIGKDKTARYEEVIPLASALLPAVSAVLRAETRAERKIKFLQTVEALRIHAADNGAFPNQLNEIKSVPVPINPDTGKPFVYKKVNEECILWEMDPRESESNPMFPGTRVLQIKLRK